MALVVKAKPIDAKTADPLPKKKNPPPSSGSLLEVLASIRKDKGDKVIVAGNQIPTVKRMPTGIFELDFALGGGFPCGRYSIVYGPESGNKTNICLKAVAKAQQLPGPCNKAVWVNIEQSFDALWAEKMGVNTADLIVVQAGYGEEAIDLIDALVRADDVAIIIVDSMAGLIASKEISQSVENYDIGTSALLIKRMVNKLMIGFCEAQKHDHFPCVILVNQTRFKPGVMFGDPETMPGGEAQKFLSSLRIRVSAKNVIDKNSSTLVFKETHVVVKKAKVPVRAVDFNFKLCMVPQDMLNIGDTDSFKIVKTYLQSMGLLEKVKDAWVLTALKKPKTSVAFSTLQAIEDKYYSDPAFQLRLQTLVLQNVKDTPILVEEADHGPKNVQPGVVHPFAGEIE
jgi:recombination protein RecA